MINSPIKRMKKDKKFRRFCQEIAVQIMLNDKNGEAFFKQISKFYDAKNTVAEVITIMKIGSEVARDADENQSRILRP